MFSDVGHTKQLAYIIARDMYSVPNRHWASIMNASPTIKEFVYRGANLYTGICRRLIMQDKHAFYTKL